MWVTKRARFRPVEHPEDRESVVAKTFAVPHFNTVEDVWWLGEEHGQTEDDARRLFLTADFLFVVETHSGTPIYLVAITPDGITQTAMTAWLELFIYDVTKLLRRYSRSEVGKATLAGTYVGCEVGDWRESWIRFLGFEHVETRADMKYFRYGVS